VRTRPERCVISAFRGLACGARHVPDLDLKVRLPEQVRGACLTSWEGVGGQDDPKHIALAERSGIREPHNLRAPTQEPIKSLKAHEYRSLGAPQATGREILQLRDDGLQQPDVLGVNSLGHFSRRRSTLEFGCRRFEWLQRLRDDDANYLVVNLIDGPALPVRGGLGATCDDDYLRASDGYLGRLRWSGGGRKSYTGATLGLWELLAAGGEAG
jgi:hypothetical protein